MTDSATKTAKAVDPTRGLTRGDLTLALALAGTLVLALALSLTLTLTLPEGGG